MIHRYMLVQAMTLSIAFSSAGLRMSLPCTQFIPPEGVSFDQKRLTLPALPSEILFCETAILSWPQHRSLRGLIGLIMPALPSEVLLYETAIPKCLSACRVNNIICRTVQNLSHSTWASTSSGCTLMSSYSQLPVIPNQPNAPRVEVRPAMPSPARPGVKYAVGPTQYLKK